jgi:hypothetical protein
MIITNKGADMSTVVGFYGDYNDAEKAVKALEDEGIDSSHISLIQQDSDPTENKKVNPWLGTYKNEKGGFIVSVETRSTEEEHIIQDILNNAGAVHMETRNNMGASDPARRYIKGTEE